MTRLARLVKGLAALTVLAALAAGMPWALWHFIGWPLPHHLPSATQVGRALGHQGIPAHTLLDALAVVVWLTWATLVASLAVEVPAALSGRHARRLPIAGAFQPLTARLLATVIVACLTLAPRAVHPGAPGGPGSRAGPKWPRPVAALVVSDATLAASTTGASPASTPVTNPTTNGPSAPAAAETASTPIIYTVQRGDTLWGIAERQLGDPLRWSEIYQLNQGRPQPGGATLTDPHWIDPGWTLLLPAPPPPAPSTPPPPGPTAATPPPVTAFPPTSSTPATSTPTTSAPTTAAGPATGHNTTAPRPVKPTSPPVRLPSGSEVAASFAAGVLSAVALGRLRRRHAYRYRPPAPGRNLAPDPLRPTLRHLVAATAATNGHQPPGPDDVPAMADDDPEHRERPDLIEVASRNGLPIELTLSELGGLTLTGPTAHQVVAGWVTALMARAGPRAAEIVMTRAAYEDVFGAGGPSPVPGLRVTDDPEQVLGALERLVLSRARQLAEDETLDVVAYRQANPWEPVPMVLAVADPIPAPDAGRWAAVAARGSRLGFAVVTCDPDVPMPARLTVVEDRKATAALPDELAGRLVGAQLFGLAPSEAADVLTALAEAEQRPDSTDDHPDVDAPDVDGAEGIGDTGATAWPTAIPSAGIRGDGHVPGEPVTAAEPEGDEPAAPERGAVVISVFGPYEIAVDGQVISRGLRTVAKELLAWLCLRPEGASVEAAVDALWPDTERGQVHKAFWQAAANLRTRLGATAEAESKVLVASGDVYRLDPRAVACDLWTFQQALTTAARAKDDRAARDALRRAVDAYRGDLLVGTDYPWVEPVRQDLHRRALDAHLRLAELDTRLGAPDAATDTLRRVIDLDRYAEEPYRRLMALQAQRGRPDAVADTWKLLQDRLAEIDVDPEPATERLYRSLTHPQETAAARARRARQRS